MISNSVGLKVLSVEEAPVYDKSTKMIKLVDVIVVKKGMENGLPSVDIQCVDESGQKYLIFTTGKILKMISELSDSAI